jgi:hypothetical protein
MLELIKEINQIMDKELERNKIPTCEKCDHVVCECDEGND